MFGVFEYFSQENFGMISFLIYYRVESDLIVKITDNSLARDLFPSDYNCLGDNENRPVKWLAVEAITHKFFSPASDVVSKHVIT